MYVKSERLESAGGESIKNEREEKKKEKNFQQSREQLRGTRATCNETDTSLRNEHNIGLRYRRMHFGLAIRCPPPPCPFADHSPPCPSPSLPSLLATKSSFTPFIRAREAARYRSIQARHSTSVAKRERTTLIKLNLRHASGDTHSPPDKQTNRRQQLRASRRSSQKYLPHMLVSDPDDALHAARCCICCRRCANEGRRR